nr:MAG TPA: hypothetical protein [Caudoviricetes sp.]
MMAAETNLSINSYIDRIVDMYYPSFSTFFTKFKKNNIKEIIKYDIVGNYLYGQPDLYDDDIRRKYIFIAVIKFLSLRNYEHIDYEIHTLRGEIQTLLFKEQAKYLAKEFIGKKREEATFNEFKTFVKKDFITNFLNYK